MSDTNKSVAEKATPSSLREFTECELQDHAIQLAALGMCCLNRPLFEGRAQIKEYLETHFLPRKQELHGRSGV